MKQRIINSDANFVHTTQIDNSILRKGSWTAFIIGTPVGLFVIMFAILIPTSITGQGLFSWVFFQ